MFPRMKAPNFTHENAADMARRATISRLERIKREKEEAQRAAREAAPIADDARKNRTLKQLDLLDGLIDDALAAKDADKFLKLSAAKERLWKLVSPTAGVLRPGKRGAGAAVRPSVQPT